MWNVILILAWGLALFNAGRALGEVPIDWPAFIVSAVVVIAAPIFGVIANREARA
jgi:hypothetical protein